MDALAKNHTLVEFDISHNDLNNEAARLIAHALERNKHVVCLNVSGNKFGAGTGGRALVQIT